MALERRWLLAALVAAPVAACGKKGEPERPSGSPAQERTYPKPDPVPWQTRETKQ
jgi:predicted small lipoprotein YifL